MPWHEIDGVRLEIPSGWTDRSRVDFVQPHPDGTETSVRLVSSPLFPDEDLVSRCSDYLQRMGAALPAFELKEHNDAVIGGVPATQVLLQWDTDAGAVIGLATMFVRSGRFWILSATTPRGKLDETDETLQAVLQSFSFP